MAIKRQGNWLAGGRVDIQQMRSIESAACNDADDLIQGILTGTQEDYIVRGLEFVWGAAIGSSANALQVNVSDAAILHPTSSVSGTILRVPVGAAAQVLNGATNTAVQGGFTPNAINYVGLEYSRTPDDTTDDTVFIWDATSQTETQMILPIAQTLNYQFIITTTTWASNVLPLATVTTDSVNNVVSVTDQRPMLCRLGTAGINAPNPNYTAPQLTTETSPTSISNSLNPFNGGDKEISSLKNWMDEVMTSILNIQGTVYWYSPLTSGSLSSIREDLQNTVITGDSILTHSETTAGQMNWSGNMYMKVIGSRLSYNILANPSATYITLADEHVAYLNLVRGQPVAPNLIWSNSSAVITSVGAVAWTVGLEAGDFIKQSSQDDSQYWQINSVDSVSQVTLTAPYSGASSGASGFESLYSWGVYQAVAVPSTNRHIQIACKQNVPIGQNTYWLFYRADDGGIPRIYFKLTGEEMEQGESIEVTDTISRNIIQYIGATGSATRMPVYSTQLGSLVAQVALATVGSGATITSGQSFTIYSTADAAEYQPWFNVSGGGGLVPIPGAIPVEIDVLSSDSAITVGGELATAIAAISGSPFSTIDNGNATVTITNTSAGATTSPANVNVSSPFTIVVTTPGSGAENVVIHDGDSLTLAIKELDQAIGEIESSLDSYVYNETLSIVTSPSGDHETAPVLSGNQVQLPPNTRNGNAAANYTVGSGRLEVYLNGQRLNLDEDYSEFGGTGTSSNQITTLQDLVDGDELIFDVNAANGTSVSSSSGVASLNSLTGALNIVAGSNITVTPSGNSITIASTGGGGGGSAPPPNAIQISDGSGGFVASSALEWDGTTLTKGAVEEVVLTAGTTINDNQSVPSTIVSYPAASALFAIIEFSTLRNGVYDVGRMLLSNDGTNVGFSVDSVSTGTSGITFTASVVGSNVVVQYTSTSTGFSGTFKNTIKYWNETTPTIVSGTGSSSNSAGPADAIQTGDGSGGFIGSSAFEFDGTTLTVGGTKEDILSAGITLNDNQVSPATAFSYTASSNPFVVIEYSTVRNGVYDVGRMLISNDGTNTGFDTDSVSTGVSGITFSASVVTGTVVVQYVSSNTGFSGTLKYAIKYWN